MPKVGSHDYQKTKITREQSWVRDVKIPQIIETPIIEKELDNSFVQDHILTEL
jgi:hypothetical protein